MPTFSDQRNERSTHRRFDLPMTSRRESQAADGASKRSQAASFVVFGSRVQACRRGKILVPGADAMHDKLVTGKPTLDGMHEADVPAARKVVQLCTRDEKLRDGQL